MADSPPTQSSPLRETSPLLPLPSTTKPEPTSTGVFASVKNGFLVLHETGILWHVFFLTLLTALSVLVVRAVYLGQNPLALLMLVGYVAIFYAIYGGLSRDLSARRMEGEGGDGGAGEEV